MTLAPIAGHDVVRRQLSDAIEANRLPQVLLFTGPGGIGKQRLALWLAQTLLCSAKAGQPCGRCPACVRVAGLAHPDLHWFVPVARPKAGDLDKQLEEVAESLEAVMAERRQNPLWTPPDGMVAHGVASARLLQRQASMTPVEGGWRVFIVGDAERLVPQESSPEAANSLLKLLEEPPARSVFVLTSAEAGMVLPTIRSRAVPIRLARLSDESVREFLKANRPDLATDAAITRANGSIGAALAATAEAESKATAAAGAFLEAVAGGEMATIERTIRQAPWQARGDFTALLDALSETLLARARRAEQAGGSVPSKDATGILAGIDRVLIARERAQGNVNPQLLLTVLADELTQAGAA